LKRLTFIASCVVSFVLGTLLPFRSTHAQTNTHTPTYYQISFMKTRPGQDPVKMERDLWKPIQTDRMESGEINSWTVMRPIFSGPHDYDYVTVESFSDMTKFIKTDYDRLFEKHWGKEKVQSAMTQTEAARDMIGNEMWVSVEGVTKQSK